MGACDTVGSSRIQIKLLDSEMQEIKVESYLDI
jgi:hypothetical protein